MGCHFEGPNEGECLLAVDVEGILSDEIASASGIQNFVRTLSGAIATSIVTTAWENGQM